MVLQPGNWSPFRVWTPLSLIAVFLLSACATQQSPTLPPSGNTEELLIVDCLLPGQVRQLGSKIAYLSPRRGEKTSAANCRIRGGEYVAFDRADAGTSLKIWMPQAEEGDAQAQTYVGEIFEKGLGVEPDFQVAALWYRRAAAQGYARAQINLGYLYESGLGVDQDLPEAMNLYRQASGIEDGTLEYVSTFEYARRETAQRDTLRLEEQVSALSDQLSKAEARYRSIQIQANADQIELDSLRLQTKTKREEITAFYLQDESKPPESAQALIEIEAVQKQLSSETQRGESLEMQLAASREEVDSLRTGLSADNQQMQQLKGELAKQLRVINSLQAELAGQQSSAETDREREALALIRNEARSTRQTLFELRNDGNEVSEEALNALADAEERELILTGSLLDLKQSVIELQSQKSHLETQYRDSINALQSELELSATEQTRVAGRLADTELSMQTVGAENQELRNRLKEQNAAVARREQEQLRLVAKLSGLELSQRSTEAEKQAAQATARVANAELALARFEQSRLVTRLVQAELNAQQNADSAARQLAILEKQLADQTSIVGYRQEQLNTLEQSVTQGRAGSQDKAAESVAQVVVAGLSIEVLDPPVLITRGPGEIPSQADGRVEMIGRVSPVDEVLAVSINGQRQDYNNSGVFDYQSVDIIDELNLVAIAKSGEKESVSFNITRDSAKPIVDQQPASTSTDNETHKNIDFGRFHAIIIGNNRYSDLSDLRTAETDARAIDKLLQEQYGFSTQLLINATKLDILSAFNTARETLTEEDNLIIYYAGHGQLDSDGARGYWLPVDATVNDTESWISNAIVTDYLDSITARQIMVVADSCFSGTLTKASIPRARDTIPSALRTKWLTLMAKRKVRTVLSSGGVKPVYDGIGKHSLFAQAFIQQLTSNQSVLEGHRLYADVLQEVQRSANELGVDQVPQYAAIKHAGHEVGEFLLVSR